jgi:demethylmenaquinone methyltransferase/2-methoxy-6-polyprenyl-1,4-benzoquinol methylase
VPDLDKSPAAVASMFSRIAPRYDALNHLLSFNRDRRWRGRAARLVDAGRRRVLDLATGTGDLAAALASPGRTVVGADFCVDMLARARRKEAGRHLSAGDALALPFPDAAFDAVTIAFGVRNFADLGKGLAEMKRVLRPGGLLLILEFSQPTGAAGAAYRVYADRILPRVGGFFSGSPEAYRYLHRSTLAWPGREALSGILRGAGFDDVVGRPLTFGVVALHTGRKP